MKLFKKKQARESKGSGDSSWDAEGTKGERGLFQRLRHGLSKTRGSLSGRIDLLVMGKKQITGDVLDDLEEVLFTSDLGVSTTQQLLESVQKKVARKELTDAEALKSALRDEIRSYLEISPVSHLTSAKGTPWVIMVVGVNGVGKTTTIGKAAQRYKNEGKSVMLIAADTYRAAAVEQLTIWGERVGAEVIKQRHGSDPSAVAFDGLSAGITRNTDVILIDTAGRLHTKKSLMEELQKIHRVIGKKLPDAPHEVWLVLDATTGQNAIAQAEMFNASLGVTGIVLTKLDGTAKGGIVVGITHQLGLPIKYIGIGEKMEDLRPFDAADFVEAIFD
jgi:fused signal recognition particle receptor